MAIKDHIRIIDLNLAKRLFSMSDEEITELVFENIEFYERTETAATGFQHGLKHGHDHLRTVIKRFLNGDREAVIYGLIADLAYGTDKVYPDIIARSIFFDDPDSVNIATSTEAIGKPSHNSEAEYLSDFFHVLETRHIDRLADEMESGLKSLPANTNHDIFLLRTMSQRCKAKPSHRPIYIYKLTF